MVATSNRVQLKLVLNINFMILWHVQGIRKKSKWQPEIKIFASQNEETAKVH